MIDPNLPLELDDGTSVSLVRGDSKMVIIRIPVGSSAHRKDRQCSGSYYYKLSTGIFSGGTAEEYYVLRNSDNADEAIPEDWS